jgi:hypothetical protein
MHYQIPNKLSVVNVTIKCAKYVEETSIHVHVRIYSIRLFLYVHYAMQGIKRQLQIIF